MNAKSGICLDIVRQVPGLTWVYVFKASRNEGDWQEGETVEKSISRNFSSLAKLGVIMR